MSFLEHLEELRWRLVRCLAVCAVLFLGCWYFSAPILRFLLDPIRRHLFDGGDIIYISLTEPFLVYMKASALAALFLGAPYLLHQFWAFVAPGLYRNEQRLGLLFIVSGTAFFLAGGAFGYYVALPLTARWLIEVGQDFKAALTLRSAFQFESLILLGMGVVFELPVLILFLSRIGVVTAGLLLRHLRLAVVAIAVLAAVITPTGDVLTMTVFAAPMLVLYLLGIVVAWFFARRQGT